MDSYSLHRSPGKPSPFFRPFSFLSATPFLAVIGSSAAAVSGKTFPKIFCHRAVPVPIQHPNGMNPHRKPGGFISRLLPVLGALAFLGADGNQAQSPRIEISRLPDSVRLAWTNEHPGFLLESATSLLPTAWSVVPRNHPVGSPIVSDLPITELTQFFRLRANLPLVPTRLVSVSPFNGEQGVSVQRETIAYFNAPLSPETPLTPNHFYAGFGGRRILSRVELSSDRRKASLFHLEPLPPNARIHVVLSSDGLRDINGLQPDFDMDGRPGGLAVFHFDTQNSAGFNGTAITGRVFASDPIPDPANPGSVTNRPLQGVRVTVDGREESLFAVTDADGRFLLHPAPIGRFFVHVDGRTAVGSQWPNGAYYPFVGKAWETVAGQTNLAGGSGEIFLPLISAGTLQPVSATEDTTITFPPDVLARNPQLEGVSITVPAGSLFADNGTRGGRVGIAPVPPDRLPEPLPEGLFMPLVITVQTDGASNFDRPVPVRFPNTPDPGGYAPAPGEKVTLMSFNHDTGRWEGVGLMTVSADGRFLDTDPGVGILQPGWHGRQDPTPEDPPLPPEDPPCVPVVNCRQLCVEVEDFERFNCRRNWFRCFRQGRGLRGVQLMSHVLYCESNDEYCREAPPQRRRICEQQCDTSCAAMSSPEVSTGRGAAVAADPLTPAQALMEQYYELHDAIRSIFQQGGSLSESEEDAFHAAIAALDAQAGGDPELLFAEEAMDLEARLMASGGPGYIYRGDQPAYPLFARVEIAREVTTCDPETRRREEVQLIRTDSYAQYRVFLRRGWVATINGCHWFGLDRIRGIEFYDPRTRSIGRADRRTIPGVPHSISGFRLVRVSKLAPDFDGDGLPDEVERIVGTDPLNPDTDGDGLPDGFEVDNGLNALDGAPAGVGVVASAELPGTAFDVDARNYLVTVAMGTDGVAVFLADPGRSPVLVAQVATPGDTRSVAIDGRYIAAADGTAGLAIVEVLNDADGRPANARRIRSVALPGHIGVVAAFGGLAYAGGNNGLLAVIDLETGRSLHLSDLGARIHDLTIAGDRLFVLLSDQLHVYSLRRGVPVFLGQTSTAGSFPEGITGRLRLFVGGDRAYVTSFPGYAVHDVSNPTAMTLLGPVIDNGPNSFKRIVLNGSGLGIAAVGINPRNDGTHDIRLYDVGNPADTTRFLTTIPTPGIARALALYGGQAYVADDSAGLQVVNYLAFDRQGVAPTITLATSAGPGANAVEEGTLLALTALATDDVQIRHVEFHLDGQPVAIDGNYPFTHGIIVPNLSSNRSSFTVRARAVDTGGNSRWSTTLTFNLLPETVPPVVEGVLPAAGGIAGSVSVLGVAFSESLDPASAALAVFQLEGAGPDGVFGTPDDLQDPIGSLSYNDAAATVFFSLDAPLPVGIWRISITGPLTDRIGNPWIGSHSWTFFAGSFIDTDQDGIADDLEAQFGFDPQKADSNGNGIPDGMEDADNDGLPNAWELFHGLNPFSRDSNGNGIFDGDEDPDEDRLSNRREALAGTSPFLPDTDGDGFNDETEVAAGSDPLNPHLPRWIQPRRRRRRWGHPHRLRRLHPGHRCHPRPWQLRRRAGQRKHRLGRCHPTRRPLRHRHRPALGRKR
jgi:hypothetical protein